MAKIYFTLDHARMDETDVAKAITQMFGQFGVFAPADRQAAVDAVLPLADFPGAVDVVTLTVEINPLADDERK